MKKRTMIAGLLGLAMWPGISHAQSCGNDSIYKIPYKDTYVKQALVAENEFRIQQPKYVTLPTLQKPSKYSLTRYGPVMKKKSTCTGVLGKSG